MYHKQVVERKLNENQFFLYLTTIPLFMILFGLVHMVVFSNLPTLIAGFSAIITSPTILITDFLEIGGVGASMINAGLVGLFNIWLIHRYRLKVNGALLAAFFTVIGFAFFGKNLYNILPIYIGGYLYTKYQKISYKEIIVVMMFGTALSPMISEINYSGLLAMPYAFLISSLVGIFAGFVIVPLSSHMLKFHDGYNLYNIGFTSGIIGTIFTSLLRSLGYDINPVSILYTNNDPIIILFIILTFIYMIGFGFYIKKDVLSCYPRIFKYRGRLVTDFTRLTGYGVTFFNMGILGLTATLIILFSGGIINGPVLAGIFTLAGFGAFGKHFKNIYPIAIGVLLAAWFFGYSLDSTTIIISVLFSSTLAPIAGTYGPFIGILAGIMHMILVTNVGIIHGGINLYNNGFSGGIVAGVFVPVIDAFKKER